MSKSLYAELGIEKDASHDEIKSAYRKLAQINHPDKGGDIEDFQAIQHAYEVLSDPARRERYDLTGSEEESNSLERQAISALGDMFSSFISKEDIDGNIVEKVMAEINGAISDGYQQKADLESKLQKASKQLGRVISKSGKDSLYQIVIEDHIEKLEEKINRTNNGIALLKAMKELAEDLEDTNPGEIPRRELIHPFINTAMFRNSSPFGFNGV